MSFPCIAVTVVAPELVNVTSPEILCSVGSFEALPINTFPSVRLATVPAGP